MPEVKYQLERILHHPLPVIEVLRSPTGHMAVVTCSSTAESEWRDFGTGGTCFVWDLEAGVCVFSFASGPTGPVWSPDGRMIIHASENGRAQVRDSLTSEVLLEVAAQCREESFESLVWHPSGEKVAVYWSHLVPEGVMDSGWVIWNLSDRSAVCKFEDRFLGWNASGTYFLTSRCGAYAIWDSPTGKVISVVEGTTFGGFSPDGRYAVTSSRSSEPETMLWEVSTGKCLARAPLDMQVCSWSADSSHVLVRGRNRSDSDARFVYVLWSAKSGDVLFERRSGYPIKSSEDYRPGGGGLAISADGTRISCYECWCRYREDVSNERGRRLEVEYDDRIFAYDLSTGIEECVFLNEGYHQASSGEPGQQVLGSPDSCWTLEHRRSAASKIHVPWIEYWDPWTGSSAVGIVDELDDERLISSVTPDGESDGWRLDVYFEGCDVEVRAPC